MTDKTKPTIERRINNLRAISADDSVNNFARSICAEASSFLAAIKDPASFVRKEDYDALQSELDQIHAICLNIAECPPIAESDTATVRYVKDMALTIKNHEHYINAMQRNSQDTNTADTVAVPIHQLEHWAEYWNGSANEKSMTDALEHILSEIDAVLQAAQEAK